MCNKVQRISLTEKQQIALHQDMPYMVVDSCIACEMTYLISKGIRTLECCCGHGKQLAYALIMSESHDAMIDLGYVPVKEANGVYRVLLKGE